jgi:hypothetical protein
MRRALIRMSGDRSAIAKSGLPAFSDSLHKSGFCDTGSGWHQRDGRPRAAKALALPVVSDAGDGIQASRLGTGRSGLAGHFRLFPRWRWPRRNLARRFPMRRGRNHRSVALIACNTMPTVWLLCVQLRLRLELGPPRSRPF